MHNPGSDATDDNQAACDLALPQIEAERRQKNLNTDSARRGPPDRPRVNLDLALRNAIRRAAVGPISVRATETTSLSTPPEKHRFSGAKRWIIDKIRRPANLLRDYLVGGIEQRLHPKIDALQAKADALNAKADVISDQLELIRSSLETLRLDSNRDTRVLLLKAEAVDFKLEELSLRARTPLKIDELTYGMRTADGFVAIPQTDTLLLLMLYDAGPQGLEPGTRRVLIRLLLPGMVFVDVGAHVGTLTLAGARRVGSGGKVVAFEPAPTTFNLLKKTIALNGLNSVIAHRAACGARQEQRRLFMGRVLGHSSFYPLEQDNSLEPGTDTVETGSSTVVTVLALDDVLSPNERVDLVKIDVEGAELEVLDGMGRVIKDNPGLAVIAEFGPSHLKRVGIDPLSWFQAFEAHGLIAYVIDELSGVCRRVQADELLDVEFVNVAFVRSGSDSQRRLLS